MGRVLLADDEPIIRQLYGEVLTKAGHDVTTAPNGETALEALRSGAFDVVLSDISMPRMSGLELLRAVRERDLDVPVLLMTAGSALKTAAQAVEYGASRFLFKPVDATLMLEAVQRAIALHELARLKRQALDLLGQDSRLLGDRASLETRFRMALETMWMAFQPIVAWRERRVLGYEALLRTDEPTLAKPDALIDAAERLGRVSDLSRAVRASTLMLEAVQRAIALHELARLKRQALDLLGQDSRLLGDRASLETRFRMALETMWMAFQPIVAWRERRVFGYEALLRTDEPTLAKPDALIDAAERLGRVSDLSRAVRAHVAARVAEAPPDVKLFINLHALDFADEQLFAVTAPLTASAKRVVLEVTERAPLDRLKDPRLRVSELRRLGFTIAVDDLGAGYAGLSSFALLEPEVVKLDLSLIRQVHLHPVKRKLVQSMVKLCGELGMTVVAEGIESPEERDTLAEAGCDLFQGHLFAHPGRGFPQPRFA